MYETVQVYPKYPEGQSEKLLMESKYWVAELQKGINLPLRLRKQTGKIIYLEIISLPQVTRTQGDYEDKLTKSNSYVWPQASQVEIASKTR